MTKMIFILLPIFIAVAGLSQNGLPPKQVVNDFTFNYVYKCEYENNQNLKAFAYYIGNQAGYGVQNISELKGAMAQSGFREALFAKLAEQSNYELDMLSANLVHIGMKSIYAKTLAQYILNKYNRNTANKNTSSASSDRNKHFAGGDKSVVKIDAHSQKKASDRFKESSKQKNEKAIFKSGNENGLDSISLFTGTKKFCDEGEYWYYLVTISDSSITLISYPGTKNDHFKNKSQALYKINGHIEGNKIITNDPPEYRAPRFKYENGVLYELNNEGGYNDYRVCE